VFERAGHALLTLLAEQFEVDDAGLPLNVELDPEDDATFHRRPRVAAVL